MTISGFQGEDLVQIYGFPIHSIHFTSPSAQDREKSASLGRLFFPNHPVGGPLAFLSRPFTNVLCPKKNV